MLCVAASTGPGYDVLDVNWKVANDVAAEHGHVMDRSALRLVAPGHVAETRDQAIAEITDGFHRWDSHMRDVIEGGGEILGLGSMEQLLEGGAIVGSIDDAVESLESYWEKSGGFGCILYQLTPWASEENQRRSLRRFAEEVMPRFTGRSRLRHASHDRSARNKEELSARAKAGAEKAILEHFQPAADPAS
jgi:limonene 1,2-monooxygenase